MSRSSNIALPETRRTARVASRIVAQINRAGIFIVLLAMLAAFTWVQPVFAKPNNLLDILQAVSVTALLAQGITISLAVGGFDLSVGSTAALGVMTSAYAQVVWQWGAVPTVLLVLAVGVAVGLLNTLLILWLRVPDLLATLGTSFLVGGLQLIPSAGNSLSSGMMLSDGSTAPGHFAAAFLWIGRARIGNHVPLPVLLLAVVAIALWVLMERTRWGRVMYAVGGNPLAAHLAGAPTARLRMAAYVLSGMLASLGGILLAARVGRGDVMTGASLLQDAFAAALIGFAVWNLRRPNILGTVVGAVFVGVLLNGLTMLDVPYYMQDFIKGMVLVASLALTYRFGGKRR
ncbi:MAG: ABC transporter permease [Janthinobacterium lividum]